MKEAGFLRTLPFEKNMEEIKSDVSSSAGKKVKKNRHSVAQNNSKFSAHCNGLDSTALKPVSSINDQIIRVPKIQTKITPWPGPLRVQSFFSPVPDSSEGNDEQIVNDDVFAFPFTVPSTIKEKTFNGINSSVQKNRKNKRSRRSGNKLVLAENIDGHRGEEDIDSLLEYINARN